MITRNGYELRVPITTRVVEVTRYDSGGITGRQEMIEYAANLAIGLATVAVAITIHPVFGVLWVLVTGLALAFFYETCDSSSMNGNSRRQS